MADGITGLGVGFATVAGKSATVLRVVKYCRTANTIVRMLAPIEGDLIRSSHFLRRLDQVLPVKVRRPLLELFPHLQSLIAEDRGDGIHERLDFCLLAAEPKSAV